MSPRDTIQTHCRDADRAAADHELVVAVFLELREGDYDIVDAAGEPVLAVTITGAEVTEVAVRS